LTAQILDGVGLAVPNISNQGVEVFVPNAKIVAILVWASIALGRVSFLFAGSRK
jgi:formate-dependent nitrite reductase membrane component NrfD